MNQFFMQYFIIDLMNVYYMLGIAVAFTTRLSHFCYLYSIWKSRGCLMGKMQENQTSLKMSFKVFGLSMCMDK